MKPKFKGAIQRTTPPRVLRKKVPSLHLGGGIGERRPFLGRFLEEAPFGISQFIFLTTIFPTNFNGLN
jgi:hypothetical protein